MRFGFALFREFLSGRLAEGILTWGLGFVVDNLVAARGNVCVTFQGPGYDL